MTSATSLPQTIRQPTDRFIAPETPAADRIDQLALAGDDQQHLIPDRVNHAAWLKQALELHWDAELPQPFIGYDSDQGAFVAEWQSETECNTLTINAENRRGWYDPWPGGDDGELPEELDLDTEQAWQLLRNALTTNRP